MDLDFAMALLPLVVGWLVFLVVSAVLVPQAIGRWCRAASFGLLFGPTLGVGCGLAVIPAWLGLAQALQPGVAFVDRLFLGGLALVGWCLGMGGYRLGSRALGWLRWVMT